MRAPNRNQFRGSPTVTARFEQALGSRPAYLAYSVLFALGRSSAGGLVAHLPKLGRQEFRFRKYHELGYRRYFLACDFLRAYAHRVTHAVALERDGNSGSSVASNYLNLVGVKESIDLFPLDRETRTYLNRRTSARNLFSEMLGSGGSRARVGRVFMLGPAGDPQGLRDRELERVCLTKPVDLAAMGLKPNQVILVLNNMWSIHRRDVVADWLGKNEGAIVFSPNDLEVPYPVIRDYSPVPEFCFGSPMGLQRALTLILSHLRPETIEIEGFDFSLSPTPYKGWYPSLRREEGFRDVRQAVLYSNLKHDFLLNYMYTKQLSEAAGIPITGSLSPYLNDSVENILALFRRRLIERR